MNPTPLSPAATPISGAPGEVNSALEDRLTLPPAGWMATASCQYTDPEVFFPIPGESLLPARRICHRCPVAAQCLRWALATGAPVGPGGLPGGEHRGRGMSTVSCTPDQLEDAVVASASTARWPDGSLLLELDEHVLRDVLVPRLLTALASTTTSGVPG